MEKDAKGLKLTGEFNCKNCGNPIDISADVGFCDNKVWNVERKKCPHCNYMNTITADIRLYAHAINELND